MVNRRLADVGLDPEHWISIPDAIALIQRLKSDGSTRDIRKALVGALIHGSQSYLEAVALEYRKGYDRIEREQPTVYRAPPECPHFLKTGFWRIGMAWDQYADHAFATGDFLFIGEVYQSELPYRMRDRSAELNNERVRLWQEASGVHVGRQVVEAIFRDRQWRQWGEIRGAVLANDPQGRGKAPKWKWDDVAASLALEASVNPEILRNGSGPIIQFVNDEMARLCFGDVPDPADVSRFARRYSNLWAPEGHVPPPI